MILDYSARELDLFPVRITHVRGTSATAIKRSLLEFRFRESVQEITPTELVIEQSRHVYTQDYIDLVKDFYLKM